MNGRAKILFPLYAFTTCRRENVTVTFTFTLLCFVKVEKRNAFRSKEGCFCLWTCTDGLGTVQANIRRPLTTECRVRIQASLLDICNALSGSGACSPLRISVSPVSIIPPMLHYRPRIFAHTSNTVRLVTKLEQNWAIKCNVIETCLFRVDLIYELNCADGPNGPNGPNSLVMKAPK